MYIPKKILFLSFENINFSVKTIQKEEEVWFQLDYLSNLKEFLASAYEVKGADAVLYEDEENVLKKVVM